MAEVGDSDFKFYVKPGLSVVLHDTTKAKQRSEWSASIFVSSEEELFIPYHFHPYSDEYMIIVSGSMEVVLSGKKYTLTPESGKFHIPKGQRHSLFSKIGVETHFREMTKPEAEAHNQFFSDMFSNGMPGPLHALSAFYREGNTVPGVGGVDWTPDILGHALVWFVGGFLGNFLGLAPREVPKKAN